MNSQLQALIALQDLDLMIRDAKDPARAGREESLGFAMDNVGKLERTRELLAKRIDERLLQTYQRMSRRFSRVVVPVEERICLGCFIGLPTSGSRISADPSSPELCENCGRILYRL